ncbi:hypothetical protein GCM10010275_06010 [Streptomyces litmocidini]|nr:hypothetical protein GCM10010275_06010 [Streptomyces litmocidini]
MFLRRLRANGAGEPEGDVCRVLSAVPSGEEILLPAPFGLTPDTAELPAGRAPGRDPQDGDEFRGPGRSYGTWTPVNRSS